MSAFLTTRGLGGRLVPSGGMGTGASASNDNDPNDWNIVATELREKDRPTGIFSQYANLSKKTP